MPRFKITIEYDGTGLVGWQRQDNGPSVQEALEKSASAIIGKRYEVSIQGAGRTDAGVHALGQVAHFDLATDFDPYKLPLALNAHLPANIRVVDAEQVDNEFHARFSATGRELSLSHFDQTCCICDWARFCLAYCPAARHSRDE